MDRWVAKFVLPNYAIGPLSKLLGDIVAFIDDKVLIEDFENLSTLKICHDMAAYSTLLFKRKKTVQTNNRARVFSNLNRILSHLT